MGNWNGTRLATVIAAAACGVGAALLPAAAWILAPIASGLVGVAFGHGITAPKDRESPPTQ